MEPIPDFDVLGALFQWALLFLIFALLYLVYIRYSRLAAKHNKTAWQYGMTGIGVFFSGLALGRQILKMVSSDEAELSDLVRWVFVLFLLAIATLISMMVYQILKKRWETD